MARLDEYSSLSLSLSLITLSQAVCCSDQAHCCPQGYVCNLEAGSSQRSILFQVQMLPLIRVMEQEPEKPGNVHEVTEVKCDDAFSCVDEETCCRAEEGWGCCPAPKVHNCRTATVFILWHTTPQGVGNLCKINITIISQMYLGHATQFILVSIKKDFSVLSLYKIYQR